MQKKFKIEVDCANCAAKIETAIKALPGVKNASVSFMAQKLLLEADDDKFDAVLKDARFRDRAVSSAIKQPILPMGAFYTPNGGYPHDKETEKDAEAHYRCGGAHGAAGTAVPFCGAALVRSACAVACALLSHRP